ncbi:GDP-mannose pyrophosphatase NudK [Flavisolibacter tropicus]|uniref:GDP-mannose pyrophosphatase n=1 Tax=Flavisolibacter tropicus TaxID=1492898 RepID=A0A172TV46_9BACT|nr:GDP-mannose pyrophosphatase NudK [Flavisolibacter tropicus]ANE50653.1 GDP-mannose pyrophosphatase [Flavisolibacter tropicus]
MKDKIKNVKTDVLSDNWYKLEKVTFDYKKNDGNWQTQSREVYDRGNGATILLYNKKKQTVVLTRQFRLPSYLNGNQEGYLIETCAGLLDEDDPVACIRREAEEETGYQLEEVHKVFEAYMTPGAVTEILYFFVGEYAPYMKVAEGGGVPHEHEEIEVLEMPFQKAYDMIASGEIKDAKTIMLLQYAKLNNLF